MLRGRLHHISLHLLVVLTCSGAAAAQSQSGETPQLFPEDRRLVRTITVERERI